MDRTYISPGVGATLDAHLRATRPALPRDLLAAVRAAHGGDDTSTQRSRPLLAAAACLSLVIAVALGQVGAASYAATAVAHAAGAVRTTVVTRTHQTALVPTRLNAGGDQYKPGYGFGDPNHNHAGPPGLHGAGPGAKGPPPQTQPAHDGKAVYVTATLSVDEQAALYFSVLDATGTQLLLTQKGTVIGGDVDGPQTKTIHYVMLVPRTVSFRIRIPANLVKPGAQYSIRVIAVDPQGNKTQTLIPFTV